MHIKRCGTAMLIAALTVGTAATATADPAATGTIEGKVWFDRDANGRINGAEPAVEPGWVSLYDRFGNHVAGTSTSGFGSYGFSDLAPGVYEVHGRQYEFGFSTPTARRVTVKAGKLTSVDFGVRGGRITGRSWKDLNANGIREAREPGFRGIVTLVEYAGSPNMGVDGHYTIEDVPLGTFTTRSDTGFDGVRKYAQSPGHRGADPARDSDFEQDTGQGPAFTFHLGANGSVRPTTPATADIGYYEGHNSGSLTLVPDRDTTALHVGDVITLTGTATFTGNALDTHAVGSSLPEGLDFTEVIPGPGWAADMFGPRYFSIRDGGLRVPPPTTTFTVRAVVTAPLTGGLTVGMGGGYFFEQGPTSSVTIPISAT